MFSAHHLELFYYVAKYGGISAAARHIPYGIGQPAVSGQMAEFERAVGAKLFERRPFQLTGQGRLIYEHIRPCHEQLGTLWEQVRCHSTQTIRLAAAQTLGPEILGSILTAAAPLPATVRFELLTGQPAELEVWVRERRVQLAITSAERGARRVCSRVLARPGLRLLVPRTATIASAGDFWRREHITEPLIAPPESDPVCQRFTRGLKALRVEWTPGICAESPRTVMQLVASGQGVGVGLDLPCSPLHPDVRALPLRGFAPVPLLILWRKPVDPLLQSLLAAADETGRKFWPASSGLVLLLVGSSLGIVEEWAGAAQFLIER